MKPSSQTKHSGSADGKLFGVAKRSQKQGGVAIQREGSECKASLAGAGARRGDAQRDDRDAALTTYKKVVDIVRKYGLSRGDLTSVQAKIAKQNNFLTGSFIRNNSTGQTFSLKDCIISSNHSPKRYHGEIQNRINTLDREAKSAGLTPVFLTITLPTEFHRMKQDKKGSLVDNPKYSGKSPRDAAKVLTKMFAKLRQDRSLKELSKSQRMYYRVNEPHKDGTPHTHILLFIPPDRVSRVERAFYRLFNQKGNKFEKDIRNAASYVMKYINKTLPLSKDHYTEDDEYLNAWYTHHRINRFCSSRSTAPMYLYRLLHHRYSLYALTQVKKRKQLKILTLIDDDKIQEIWDDEELIFMRGNDFTLYKMAMAA